MTITRQIKQRHILGTARKLFFQSNLPIKFCGDCIQFAVHLINRMLLMVLKGKSPYEVLFGTKPTYTHLKVFRCLCFVSTLKRERHKFMPRVTNKQSQVLNGRKPWI